ncbi:hypothetical protein B0H13DRAFT_2512954 [Mycena leptocephala]|nr:hypothetical protein B0H13DRAFT_2512954 [Mycena leptocephala]
MSELPDARGAQPLGYVQHRFPVRPEFRFVEPVTDVLHRDAHVESLADDREHDDALLMTVGEEDPYRPSLASPSPAPASDEEPDVQLDIPPRPLAEEEVASVRVESDMPPAPSEKAASPITVQPPSPAWGNAALLSPQAPAPAALARVLASAPPPSPRKLERANEEEVVCQLRGPAVARDGGGGCKGGVVEAEDSKEMVLEGVARRHSERAHCRLVDANRGLING